MPARSSGTAVASWLAMARAAPRARPAGSSTSVNAEDRQGGIALELVDDPAVVIHHVDHHVEEPVQQRHHLAGIGGGGEGAWTRTMSTKRTPTSRTSPPSSTWPAIAERATLSPT